METPVVESVLEGGADFSWDEDRSATGVCTRTTEEEFRDGTGPVDVGHCHLVASRLIGGKSRIRRCQSICRCTAFEMSSVFLENGGVVVEPLVNVFILCIEDASNKILAANGGCRHGRGGEEDATAVAVVGWEAGGKSIRDLEAFDIQSGATPPFVGVDEGYCPFMGMGTNVLELLLKRVQAS